jgi:chromosome segregation ATPase
MSLEQAILDRLEKRNAQIAQLQSTVHALERASDSQREHAIMERGRLLEENKTLAERIERMEESSGSQEALQRKDAEIQEWLMQLEKARNERDAALREAESLRSQVPLESTREALKNAVAKLQEVTTERDQEASDAATARADAQRLGDECARLAGKVAELEAQKSNASPIGYISKADYDAAVTAARENGSHKGESLSGFIWRQCESLRKSQAENAPLSKVFTAICKQRGNLNEEIIYRAVDEASDAIKKLTA